MWLSVDNASSDSAVDVDDVGVVFIASSHANDSSEIDNVEM